MKKVFYGIADALVTIYAIGIAFSAFDVPSERVVAVVAFWALSEGFRSMWRSKED